MCPILRFIQEAEASEDAVEVVEPGHGLPLGGGGAAGAAGRDGDARADRRKTVLARQGKWVQHGRELRSTVKTLASMIAPGQAQSVSQVLGIGSGNIGFKRSQRCHMMGGGKFVVRNVTAKDTSSRHRRSAACSHVDGTKKALGRFVSGSDVVIVTEVGDDATMWTRIAGCS